MGSAVLFILRSSLLLYSAGSGVSRVTFVTFVCLAVSNWPPGHPRSDHHVSNPHRPDYYCIQAGREDPQCS